LNEQRSLQVAANSQSSSFLSMKPEHVRAFPGSAYVGTELVYVKRIDSVFEEVAWPEATIWLKMDVQGFEAQVIEGAAAVLNRIDVIQTEVSLETLYEGEPTLISFLPFMAEKGFGLVSLETYLSDPVTSHLLQAECIFRRTVCDQNI
jgi:hypothetical protein